MNTRKLPSDFSANVDQVEKQTLTGIKLIDLGDKKLSLGLKKASLMPKKIMPTHSMIGMKSYKPKKLR